MQSGGTSRDLERNVMFERGRKILRKICTLLPRKLCRGLPSLSLSHALLSSSTRSKKQHSKAHGFCPGKGCHIIFAISDHIPKEAICKSCEYRSCWVCKRESHSPANCELAKKWESKTSSDDETLKWILATFKQCPNCKQPTENWTGCNHMIHRRPGGCGHEFCW